MLQNSLVFTGARGRLASIIATKFEDADASVIRISRTGGGKYNTYDQLFNSKLLHHANAVLHLAWSSLPATAELYPERIWLDDLPLLAKIIKEISDTPQPKRPLLIYFSSGGAVYGEREKPACETDLLSPIGWYGIGKVAAENLLENYAKMAGVDICILRVSNPYGFAFIPDKPQGIIAAALNAIETGSPISLFGGGEARKDFIHILDLSKAVEICVERHLTGIYNVCFGVSFTIREVINKIEIAYGKKVPNVCVSSAIWDVQSSLLSNEKFCTTTGWQPSISLQEGIETIINSMNH